MASFPVHHAAQHASPCRDEAWHPRILIQPDDLGLWIWHFGSALASCRCQVEFGIGFQMGHGCWWSLDWWLFAAADQVRRAQSCSRRLMLRPMPTSLWYT